MSYEHRRQSVSVHAGSDTNAGEADEQDILMRIEHVRGGAGDDRIVGDERRNDLWGSRGADTLIGKAGRDNLAGGTGGDRLRGGRDADVLTGARGVDALRCGTGEDLINAWRWRVRETMPHS